MKGPQPGAGGPVADGLRLRSFAMGGFEGATMRLDTGRRVDVVAGSRHDAEAATDYGLLAGLGIRTAREAMRWHLIEPVPGRYDWSTVLSVLRAATGAGVEVIWDLCHFGLPDDVDPWCPGLPERFGAFAGAAGPPDPGRGRCGAPVVSRQRDQLLGFRGWRPGPLRSRHPWPRGGLETAARPHGGGGMTGSARGRSPRPPDPRRPGDPHRPPYADGPGTPSATGDPCSRPGT